MKRLRVTSKKEVFLTTCFDEDFQHDNNNVCLQILGVERNYLSPVHSVTYKESSK